MNWGPACRNRNTPNVREKNAFICKLGGKTGALGKGCHPATYWHLVADKGLVKGKVGSYCEMGANGLGDLTGRSHS